MKVFAVILLCAFAAVQGRSAGLQSASTAAALGENPWVVHLRYAVSTSGLLSTCGGALIDSRWVLTSASCVSDLRFVWIRYGAVNVINPSLVTEGGAATPRIHPEYDSATGANDIALLSINRDVHSTENIAPISISSSAVPSSGRVCAYGAEDSQPGRTLSCFAVTLAAQEDGLYLVSSEEGEITQFDIGSAVESAGELVGVIVSVDEDGAAMLSASAYLDWISETTEPTSVAAVPAVEKVSVVEFAY